jgi:hypothetical protein
MLTLADEFVLLNLKDEGGAFLALPRHVFGACLAGAILMDLALRGRIDSDLDHLFVVNRHPTDHPALDDAMERIREHKDVKKIAESVRILAARDQDMKELILFRLCQEGILTRRDGKALWVFPTRRYPIRDGRDIVEVKLRLLGILLRGDLPDGHDACLLSLVSIGNLDGFLVPPADLVRAQQRLDQLSRLELIGRRVREYIAAVQADIDIAQMRGLGI